MTLYSPFTVFSLPCLQTTKPFRMSLYLSFSGVTWTFVQNNLDIKDGRSFFFSKGWKLESDTTSIYHFTYFIGKKRTNQSYILMV